MPVGRGGGGTHKGIWDRGTLPRGNRRTDTMAGINVVGRIILYLVTYLPYAVYSNNNMYR